MRSLLITCVSVLSLAALPIGCGSDDEDPVTASGGKSGSGGSGASGGSAGSSSGGSSGASTGGSSGSSSGGSSGASTGGTAGAAGASTGGSAGTSGDAGPSGVSNECKTCVTTNCALELTACVANAACASCANTDYQAPGCKNNPQYEAICACATGNGKACNEACGSFCVGVN
jgi:hypothetical protein